MRALLLVLGGLLAGGLVSAESFITPSPLCYSASATGFWYLGSDDGDAFGGVACRDEVNWLYAVKELETQVVSFTITTPRGQQACDWPPNEPLVCTPEGTVPSQPGDRVDVQLTRTDSGFLTGVFFAGFTR